MLSLRTLTPVILPLVILAGAANAQTTTTAPVLNPVSGMFTWWNAQMADHKSFTEAGFATWFTADAELVIDGEIKARGRPALTQHFAKIQNSGAEVEIVVPFADEMVSADKIYTYHVIRSRRDHAVSCLLAAGAAEIDGGKIKRISLVRTRIEPGTSAVSKACWDK